MVDNHQSDCATHNMPASANGPCDCKLSEPCPRCDGQFFERHTGSIVNCAYEGAHLEDMPPSFMPKASPAGTEG